MCIVNLEAIFPLDLNISCVCGETTKQADKGRGY